MSVSPNPAGARTVVRHDAPIASDVSLTLFDATRRLATTLDNSMRKPGRYMATWDGTDIRDRRVANGIRFYRLDVPGFRSVKKAMLMR